ncbi:MAG: acetyltransferase [Oscillospiraceae bacterium]|nr:acetyltransferase [Oscillospiraceae bacterium]
MCNRLVIIGAGGHGKVIADIALKRGYTDIVFADDNAVGFCMEFPIICKSTDVEKLNDGQTDFVIGIGNNEIRKRIAEQHKINWCTLVHPSAQIGMNVKIGSGTVVMAGAVINSCATVGEHCVINTSAVVEHDSIVGDFVHISPRATLCGVVTVGENTHIGAGATVVNTLNVCADCVIGAGAVVVDNIDAQGTYVGVPARKAK